MKVKIPSQNTAKPTRITSLYPTSISVIQPGIKSRKEATLYFTLRYPSRPRDSPSCFSLEWRPGRQLILSLVYWFKTIGRHKSLEKYVIVT